MIHFNIAIVELIISHYLSETCGKEDTSVCRQFDRIVLYVYWQIFLNVEVVEKIGGCTVYMKVLCFISLRFKFLNNFPTSLYSIVVYFQETVNSTKCLQNVINRTTTTTAIRFSYFRFLSLMFVWLIHSIFAWHLQISSFNSTHLFLLPILIFSTNLGKYRRETNQQWYSMAAGMSAKQPLSNYCEIVFCKNEPIVSYLYNRFFRSKR